MEIAEYEASTCDGQSGSGGFGQKWLGAQNEISLFVWLTIRLQSAAALTHHVPPERLAMLNEMVPKIVSRKAYLSPFAQD
jgi:hypothetical protein